MVLIVKRKGRGRMKKKKKKQGILHYSPQQELKDFSKLLKKSDAVGIRLGGVH